MSRPVLAAFWAALSLSGCLPLAEISEAEQGIIGGTTDNGDPGVVLIEYRQNLEDYLCTGEVVSPHVVLTAAHCVESTGGTYRVFVGTNRLTAKSTDFIAVKEVHSHPMWNSFRITDGNDVGVVITQTE